VVTGISAGPTSGSPPCTVIALLNKHAGTGQAWLTRLHDSYWVSYQPGSRYWIFQLILVGGTLLAAMALAAVTITLIRDRRA
jgi:hypothetical protein